MIINNIKEGFPIFNNIQELIFLDNASTTQKPNTVIDAISNYYKTSNANVHRGLYPLAENSTKLYEDSRRKVAEFIGSEIEEIIFTSGTTDGINVLAQSLSNSGLISSNPKILLTDLEHHSNLLPWQQVTNVKLTYLKINNLFEIDFDSISENNFDIIAVSLVSNVTGTITNIDKLRKRFPNSIIVIDAAQAIGHMPINVKKLDCDFLTFSAHKMYGPMGIGVLFGKKELLNKLQPFKTGGGMISQVGRDKSSWDSIPYKFEAGTPNVEGAIGLSAAIKFIEKIGFNTIEEHEEDLRKYSLVKLEELNKKTDNAIRIFQNKNSAKGVISFYVKGTHPHDLAQFLGDNNICVRAGHHCTQIFHREVLQIPATLRISFGVYNTKEEVDKFINILDKAIEKFRNL